MNTNQQFEYACSPSLLSRVLGTTLCCLLAVGACFADDQTLDSIKPEATNANATDTPSSDKSTPDKSSKMAPAVGELSVAPLQHKIYPDERPEWIVAEPVLEGERQTWPVVSIPALTRSASEQSLVEQQRIAVAAYINQITNSHGRAAEVVHFDDAEIAARLVYGQRSYSGIVTTSSGEMHEDAVELVFDEAFRSDVQKQWQRSEVGERLAGLGVLGAGGLALLFGLTSILKIFHRR